MQHFINNLTTNLPIIGTTLLLGLTLMFAVLLIKLSNPVYAALSLILTFFLIAISWITLNAEFLAFMLILIYVGAIMVLFLFIIMMLDLKSYSKNSLKSQIFALTITIGLGTIFVYVAKKYNFLVTSNITVNNVSVLANTLFTNNLLSFFLAGLILLTAIVSAICLSHNIYTDRKYQSVLKQMLDLKNTKIELRDNI